MGKSAEVVHWAFPSAAWGVEVVAGPVPEHLESPTRDAGFLQMSANEFLVKFDGIGRLLITRDRVTVEPEPGLPVERMDFLVYGWAPRMLRILREEFSLHGSAVIGPAGAVGIMGQSGAGKSTTVSALTGRGYGLIIDDVLPVDMVDGVAMVHGWDRPVHLTDEAAGALVLGDPNGPRVSLDGKQQVMLGGDTASRPLSLIVHLVPDDECERVTARALSGVERLSAVIDNSDSTRLSSADGRAPAYFRWATAVAASVPVCELRRPSTGWHLHEVVDCIESLMDGSPD